MSETPNLAPIPFLRRLIAAARSGEDAVQRIVADRLGALGCTVETIAYEPSKVTMREEFAATGALVAGERRAVLARLKGSGGGRSVILFAHPDNEPLNGLDAWRHDPFAGDIVDGRLHGWGVADDLAGVAAMVCGLELALADGWRPRGDILIASTPSKRHARGVAALLQRLPKPDAAIYLHPAESGAGMGEIKACTCGLLEFRITCDGHLPATNEPSHTAFAHRAGNPVAMAELVLRNLASLNEQRGAKVRHARLEAAVGRATNILISSIQAGSPGVHARVHECCVLDGSVSFPPGEGMDGIQREVEKAVALPNVSIEWRSGVAGAEIAPDHPLFLAVADAIARTTGRPPFVNPLHTSSDIRVPIVQQGIPTVGFGPLCGDLAQNGRHDEWVDAADYERCCAVLGLTLRDWCG